MLTIIQVMSLWLCCDMLIFMKNLKLAFATGYTADSVFGSVRKDRAVRSRPGTAVDTSDKWAVIRKHFPKVPCCILSEYLIIICYRLWNTVRLF